MMMNRGRRLGGGDKEAVLCQSTVGVGRYNLLLMVCVGGFRTTKSNFELGVHDSLDLFSIWVERGLYHVIRPADF